MFLPSLTVIYFLLYLCMYGEELKTGGHFSYGFHLIFITYSCKQKCHKQYIFLKKFHLQYKVTLWEYKIEPKMIFIVNLKVPT